MGLPYLVRYHPRWKAGESFYCADPLDCWIGFKLTTCVKMRKATKVQLHIPELKLERSIQRKPASIDAWTRIKLLRKGLGNSLQGFAEGWGVQTLECFCGTVKAILVQAKCRDATTSVGNLHFVANAWPFRKNSLDLQISQRFGAFSSQKSANIIPKLYQIIPNHWHGPCISTSSGTLHWIMASSLMNRGDRSATEPPLRAAAHSRIRNISTPMRPCKGIFMPLWICDIADRFYRKG